MQALPTFLAGMTTMGFLIAGLFFSRFWVRTRDSLFATFGIAFFLLAVNQAVIRLADIPREDLIWAYGLRILAFSMLIYGVIKKNLYPKARERR